LSIDITIEDNLKKVDANLKLLKNTLLPIAMRQALNKTLSSVVTKTVRKLREERALKAVTIKGSTKKGIKGFMKTFKSKGKNINKLKSKMWITGRSIPMIEFVRGSKDPREQKGIPVKRRKKISVRIRPGKTFKKKKLFIAKSNKGRNMVFRRMDNQLRKTPNQKGPIAEQSTTSLASIFRRRRVSRPIETFARRKLLIEFKRSFKLQMSKMKK